MNVPFNEPYAPDSAFSKSSHGPDLLRTQGKYYEACKKLLRRKFGFEHIILTPSCTSALELIALTLDIKPGDEIILPSFTYVSTANAFALRGAKLIFVDTYAHHPSIDIKKIEEVIGPKTRAIVVVHYGGLVIDFSGLRKLKKKYNIPVIEDAAHCIGTKAGNEFVGSIGDFATFSFHETKNISCGQGGAVVINNIKYLETAHTVAQCGTDKINFIHKKVNFYSWKSLGSNFLLAEPLCAMLLASLKLIEKINKKRIGLSKKYHRGLLKLEKKKIILSPIIEGMNGHIFYILTRNSNERLNLIQQLKSDGIEATFHYYPLHLTDFSVKNNFSRSLRNTESISERIVRLPMYYNLTPKKQEYVISRIKEFYK